MFFHFLSFSFIFWNFLSFSFICLSFSFIFLSCSFICLSFSFSLLGAQNLIFFGPQFRYDFSWQFLMWKINFWAISGGIKKKKPVGPLFLFFLLLFSPVFSFFLLFRFSFFYHFLFISSFSDFLMFFIFHFSEEKVSSFLFTCISFKYFFCWR